MIIRNTVLLASLLSLTACAATTPGVMESSAMNYNTAQAGVVQQVVTGTVLAVQPVKIGTTSTNAGGMGGALVGGALGSLLGRGTGSVVGMVAGAAAGGIAGSALEARADVQDGYQITVRLDNGNTVAVTQAADVPVKVGERVQITGGYGTQARVTPI